VTPTPDAAQGARAARRAPSLRTRLLVMLLGATALVWVAVALATWRDAHRQLDTLLDAHLAQSTSLLTMQSAHELRELDFADLADLAPYGQKVAFQIWDGGRELVLKSSDAPLTYFSPVQQGFSDVQIGAKRWRVYSSWDRAHLALVQVAEDSSVRDGLAARIASSTLLPLLLGLPLIALAVGWAVSRALHPLTLLGREVERRSPQALDPIGTDGVPVEVAPLVERLNPLFARVRQSLEQERRFTANAAHELRNPLAALRAQAEVARDANDAGRTRAALDHVIIACDRLTRLVGQLLLLARTGEQAAPREACRLDLLARDAVAALAPAALEAGQEVALEAALPVTVQGNATLLEALLRNLIDNALRHGGPAVHVLVTVGQRGGRALLEVLDDGRGVDAAALAMLGTPFQRPEGTAAAGSGLGLALVRRIAEWHDGEAVIGNAEGTRGLRVEVSLPQA
jgi:two-component system sensor histidine kinase QseC